jgi:hypothetical protein
MKPASRDRKKRAFGIGLAEQRAPSQATAEINKGWFRQGTNGSVRYTITTTELVSHFLHFLLLGKDRDI